MMLGIVFLVVFFSAAVMPGQSQNCRTADWWGSFDKKGVSECQSGTTYIRGLYRTEQQRDDGIYLLEEAKCCSRDVAFSNSPSQVVYADWWHSFDRNNHWNSCPSGFFLQGLYRSGGSGGLWLIEDGVCSKPATHPRYYGDCIDHSVYYSFDKKGWSECPTGYFLTGLYRGGCDKLYCLETFRCCKMTSGPAPLTSHEEVKTRVMDITMAEISLLAHYLGYGWCAGCRPKYVGQDFQRRGDTWVADQTRQCEGYQAHRRLSINYGDWSYVLKNMKYSKAVFTELTPQVIDSGTITNSDPNPTTASVERTEEVVTSVTHTNTSQWKTSFSLGFKIGYTPPSLTGGPTAESSFNFDYETSTTKTNSEGKQEKKTFTVNQKKTIPGHSAVRWRLVLSKTRTTVSYTATVIPRFSAELRGFLRWGHGYNNPNTNYHRDHRGSGARPDFNYRFGNSSTPFYQALKQESHRSSNPWLWMDMKTAHPGAQGLIDRLTNENRYEFTLTGTFEEVSGHNVDFDWKDIPITESGGRRRRSLAQHNETVTVVKTVAKTQAGDPPPEFPDPPQVLLDPGTPYEVTEPMIDDV